MRSIGTYSTCWCSIVTSCAFTNWIESFTSCISCYTISWRFTIPLITWTAGISVCLKCFAVFRSIYTLSIWSSSNCVSSLALETSTIRKEYASTVWICLDTSSIIDHVITWIALITIGGCGLDFTIRHSTIDKCQNSNECNYLK